MWQYYTWPWVSLTWLLYNLQLWRQGRGFRKFTVRFRPNRKELDSSMYNNWYYYTLNSLSLFGLAESVRWMFEITAYDPMTSDYAITTSRTLKVTGARVIMSSSRALCCLLLVKKQKRDSHVFRSMYNKTIIRFGFCGIQNNQRLSADNSYLDLNYSTYNKNRIQ